MRRQVVLRVRAWTAASYGDNASAVQAAIKSELFLPSWGAYSPAKAENASQAQPPNAARWYESGPQQLWPIMTGVVEPDDPQAVQALSYLDTYWGHGPRNWTHNTVDEVGQYWASAGHAAHLAGLQVHASTHTQYVLCRIAGAYPAEAQYAWPFHVGEAGFLLQNLDDGLDLGEGTFVCPPHGPGAWVE